MQFTMLVDGCRCNGTPIVGLPSTASSRFCCHKSYVNYLFLHDQGEVIDCFTFVVFFPLARGGTLDLSELLSPSPPAASDLNCELRISVGSRSQWPLPDLSQTPERMSEYMPESMSEWMPDNRMSDRMSKSTPERMSE
jgi:hypothetical protein